MKTRMVRAASRVDNNMISEVEITSCAKIKGKMCFTKEV